MLGLVISSINKFAAEISEDKIVKRHIDRVRTRTLERTVTSERELELRKPQLRELTERRGVIRFFTQADPVPTNGEPDTKSQAREQPDRRDSRQGSIGDMIPPVRKRLTIREAVKRKPKLILLKEEKDRFDAMRRIEHQTDRFRRWWRLALSVVAFGLLWCVGAIVFWQVERHTQGLTYFQSLYFCYVSLLTIGYGDLAPKSNAGRPFFVVWALIAVPTMTILISDMGDTVISGFKNGTFALADFTVLPKAGVWRKLVEKSPRLMNWLQQMQERKRIKRGMPGPEERFDREIPQQGVDLEELAHKVEAPRPSSAKLARELASAIKRVAHDLTLDTPKKYSYEEWLELTRLIRFTADGLEKAEEDQDALLEWDWIGEDSPLMSGHTEAEFLLERLTESLKRYMARVERVIQHVNIAGPSEGINIRDAARGRGDDSKDEDTDSSIDRIDKAVEKGGDALFEPSPESDRSFADYHWKEKEGNGLDAQEITDTSRKDGEPDDKR